MADAHPLDSGLRRDATVVDGGDRPDAAPDTGSPDTGTPDSGTPDSGTDSGTPDSGTPDSGSPDTGTAWQVIHNLNQPRLEFVYGVATDDIWGVGSSPRGLFHYDGDRWSMFDPNQFFNGMWGSSSSDIWGVKDQVHHYDGAGWSIPAGQPSLPPGITIEDVWGRAHNDVWAVGSQGLVLHYDGVSWIQESTSIAYDLNAVRGTPNGELWVAGDDGALYTRIGTSWVQYQHGLGAPDLVRMTIVPNVPGDQLWAVGSFGTVWRYDGSNWTSIPTGTGNWLHTIWGTSPTDVLLGGADVFSRYSGSQWIPESIPIFGMERITGVFGLASNDVWAVGYDHSGDGIILHDSGAGWTDVIDAPTRDDVALIAGTAWNEIWASSGSSIIEYGGTDWTIQSPGPAGTPTDFFACAPGDLWATAHGGRLLHYTNGSWSTVIPTGLGDSQQYMYAIWGSSCADIWAFGVDNGTTTPETILLHYENGTWTRIRLFNFPTGLAVVSLFGFADNDIWGVSTGYRVVHFDGSIWSDTQVSNLPAGDIWGAAADDVWIIGRNGLSIFHYDGSTWTPFSAVDVDPNGPPAANMNLGSIHGLSASNIWAVGGNDTMGAPTARVFHYNGVRWREMPSPGAYMLRSVWGDTGFWAVGDEGTFLFHP